MEILRKLLGPSNSLILVYDHLTDADMEEFDAQIEDVAKYYRFAKLSEIGDAASKGSARGLAAVVFSQARKSLMLRALPLLRGSDIPVTIFLDPDCIGLNRLPAVEELRWYSEKRPDVLGPEELARWTDTSWTDPRATAIFLADLRKRLGPLPLDNIDPTLYFSTWGKLTEIPPWLREAGLLVSSAPTDEARLAERLQFVRQQMGTEVPAAYNPKAPEGTEVLKRLGIRAVLGSGRGIVEKGTDPFNLPCWALERSVDE